MRAPIGSRDRQSPAEVVEPRAIESSDRTLNRRVAAEPMLKVSDLASILGVSRRTIYNIGWFWDRVVYVGEHSPRWHASNLRLRFGRNAEHE